MNLTFFAGLLALIFCISIDASLAQAQAKPESKTPSASQSQLAYRAQSTSQSQLAYQAQSTSQTQPAYQIQPASQSSAVLQPVAQSQWRGPNRDGIYPESNLLKKWPAEGPKMLWSCDGLGTGMGSVAVYKERVYVTGIPDTLTSEGFLFAFDTKGNCSGRRVTAKTGPAFSREPDPLRQSSMIFYTSKTGMAAFSA